MIIPRFKLRLIKDCLSRKTKEFVVGVTVVFTKWVWVELKGKGVDDVVVTGDEVNVRLPKLVVKFICIFCILFRFHQNKIDSRLE